MVHYLMKSQQQRPKFRAYLAGLPSDGQATAANRVAHAEKHFGSLKKLDRELADTSFEAAGPIAAGRFGSTRAPG